jgi:hypothetical protein
MLDQIFLDLIKQDFIKAIGKHAQQAGIGKEEVQIQIKLDAETGLSYAIYHKWNCVVPKCTFKDVMHIKLDVFGKEQILAPKIYELLIQQVGIYDANAALFSAFLYERHKTICCALHDGKQFVRNCTLQELFQT